jgi:hypothetical protein
MRRVGAMRTTVFDVAAVAHQWPLWTTAVGAKRLFGSQSTLREPGSLQLPGGPFSVWNNRNHRRLQILKSTPMRYGVRDQLARSLLLLLICRRRENSATPIQDDCGLIFQ